MNKNVINRKIIMLKSGISETAAAKNLGVKPQAVNNEVRGCYKSGRIRDYLCEVTQTTPAEFWPEFQKSEEAVNE